MGDSGRQGEFLSPFFFSLELQAVRSQFRPEQSCEVLWELPPGRGASEHHPVVCTTSDSAPHARGEGGDVSLTALLAELWWLPLVSTRPSSLSDTAFKFTDNYTQMCDDSSGNQRVKCVSMKLPRQTNKRNKQTQKTVNITLKHTLLCSGLADLFLLLHLFKCLPLRKATFSYWAVYRSWYNGISDLGITCIL